MPINSLGIYYNIPFYLYPLAAVALAGASYLEGRKNRKGWYYFGWSVFGIMGVMSIDHGILNILKLARKRDLYQVLKNSFRGLPYQALASPYGRDISSLMETLESAYRFYLNPVGQYVKPGTYIYPNKPEVVGPEYGHEMFTQHMRTAGAMVEEIIHGLSREMEDKPEDNPLAFSSGQS
jgi:hypothetical protein